MKNILDLALQELKKTLSRFKLDSFSTTSEQQQMKARIKMVATLNRANLLSYIEICRSENSIIVAKYINRSLAEQLINEGIEFFDCSGNTFIKTTDLVLCCTGKKQNKEVSKAKVKALMTSASLRVIFNLLLEHATPMNYREIANRSRVSIGSVKQVIDRLEADNFLEKKGKGSGMSWRLINLTSLTRKWVEFYHYTLRDKVLVNTFSSSKVVCWTDFKIDTVDGKWGGEVAAYELTKNIQPEIKTIYLDGTVNKLIAKLKLTPDPTGDIEVLDIFWKPTNECTVPPLLIYADLMGSADSRNLEVANEIREKYLKEFFYE